MGASLPLIKLDGAIDIEGVLIVYNEITKIDEDVQHVSYHEAFFKAAESCCTDLQSHRFHSKIRCEAIIRFVHRI